MTSWVAGFILGSDLLLLPTHASAEVFAQPFGEVGKTQFCRSLLLELFILLP